MIFSKNINFNFKNLLGDGLDRKNEKDNSKSRHFVATETETCMLHNIRLCTADNNNVITTIMYTIYFIHVM